VDARIKEAYCWLLVPYIDRQTDMKTVLWDAIRISGGNDSIILKAAKKLAQNEAVISQWAPSLLLMELNNVLWRETNDIQIKKLWEYLCTYCYLPRLANMAVLEDAIRTGLDSTEYFAYAAAFDGARYLGLKFNQRIDTIEHSGYLVKTNIAKPQLAEEATKHQQPSTPGVGDSILPKTTGGNDDTPPSTGNDNPADPLSPEIPKHWCFNMSALLDNTRINRDVQRLMEEVISHLTAIDGAQTEISLEVHIAGSKGLSPQAVRTVTENCRTLKVQDFGFEE
jgi:hypothetical protein